jgi:hypothetical protein
MEGTVFDVDYVHSEGRDLGWRIPLNQRNPGSDSRQFADIPFSPANVTIDISDGKSKFDGINFGIRRRMMRGLQFSAWYALSKATSTTGNASDELNINNIQNHLDPYADVQIGPSGRTDARHKTTISVVWQAPFGFTISPVYRFRSALPVNITEGRDLNSNGINNDLHATAYAFDGLNDDGTVNIKELGPCETINCGRGASQSQLNLRISKGFRLFGTARVEAIGEIFNVLNVKNPNVFSGARFLAASGAPNPNFLVPQNYAGDFQNPEQRIGQVGFRFTF